MAETKKMPQVELVYRLDEEGRWWWDRLEDGVGVASSGHSFLDQPAAEEDSLRSNPDLSLT